MQRLFADHLWTASGWLDDVLMVIDGEGRLASLIAGQSRGAAEFAGRWVLPGLPNLHSHAFQRAMAGLAERQGDPQDSFWTWRELMYAFAQQITPAQLQAIAAQLYLEMLEAGYSQVCEFHYLHHAPGGVRYADPTEMSRVLLAAAEQVGIGITLLPVLYQTGGFDGRPLSARQSRFGCSSEDYLELLDRLQPRPRQRHRLGVCFHSLRAVPEGSLREVLAARPQAAPIHIHIAEQQAEVEECLQRRGSRPVAWLLDHAAVDARWCLVHATHLSGSEVNALAASSAVAGLCPSTEGNLGDGFFPLADYLAAGGVWGIGSDSHVSISPVEELRWLEYGQRLRHTRRNIAAGSRQPSCGENLFAAAVAGGRQACGLPGDPWLPGQPVDLLVLDEQAPTLLQRGPGELLDSWIFAGNRPLVRAVMTAGRWRVRDGRHPLREPVVAAFAGALRELRAAG